MKLRKKFICSISLMLTFILMVISPIQSFAAINKTTIESETEIEVIFDEGSTRIDYYETSTGDRVFLQYENNVLVQKDILSANYPDKVKRIFYDTSANAASARESINSDFINISDYITSEEGEEKPDKELRAALGTIKYSTVLSSGKKNYGIKCSYTSSTGDSTYTIKSFTGKLVDLVALLVGSTNLVAKIGTSFIKSVCVSAGISIVGGVIKKALSTTVASKRTKYTWKLVDTTLSSHTKKVYGYKFYVTDSRYHTGETYYEGYKISAWKTRALAVSLHNEMFSYSAFTVEGWS